MPLRLKRDLMKDKAQLQEKSRQKFSVLHLSLNSSSTIVFRLPTVETEVLLLKQAVILDERHNSKLLHFLSVPVFEKRLFPCERKFKMQSIHIKHLILPVYINMCCDCSTSSSSGEILIGMKASRENKALKYILSSSSLSSLSEETLKS